MTVKVRHLMEKIASLDVLKQAADDAYQALHDKNVWYARKFIKERDKSILRIQRMIITGVYPKKEYHPMIIVSKDKKREICPTDFDPWSILFHSVKIVLEPIVERVLIYDSSAGRTGKGQTFCAKRTRQYIRRHQEMTYFAQADIKKFYQSIPHWVVLMVLRRYIDDERFIDLIRQTILDYESDIEDVLLEEDRKKRKNCSWASTEILRYKGCNRGITIGNCISQLLGNLVMSHIDRYMTQTLESKGYHRHCDDTIQYGENIERATYLLNQLDRMCNHYGLCIKHNSVIAPIEDENRINNGRLIDYVGYSFSRNNMRMRTRTKKRMAKSLSRVKSRKRRRELLASYWGIAKWGKCMNLWRTVTKGGKMSFKQHGIVTSIISHDKRGRRVFNVPEEKISALAQRRTPIMIYDFEGDVDVKGNPGRCYVLYGDMSRDDGEKKKFCTTSETIISKLTAAKKGNILPESTYVFQVFMGGGHYTYDID